MFETENEFTFATHDEAITKRFYINIEKSWMETGIKSHEVWLFTINSQPFHLWYCFSFEVKNERNFSLHRSIQLSMPYSSQQFPLKTANQHYYTFWWSVSCLHFLLIYLKMFASHKSMKIVTNLFVYFIDQTLIVSTVFISFFIFYSIFASSLFFTFFHSLLALTFVYYWTQYWLVIEYLEIEC